MRYTILLLAGMMLSSPAVSQEQQAGNEASTNAADTFQKLVDQCDDMDMLMLRARLRLEISRATEEAANMATSMLTQGFTECAEGNVEAGKETLSEAYEIARSGVTQAYGQDASVETTAAPQVAEPEESANDNDAETASKPWWKFW